MAKVITLEEVQKHKSGKGEDKSVWFVIHDKVYDVSAFLEDVSGKMEWNVHKATVQIHPVWFITDTSNFRLVCPLKFPYTVHATLLI